MSRSMIDVSHDLRSRRLLLCTQGSRISGLVEEPHAKALSDHARAVRMILEAGQVRLAKRALERYQKALLEARESKTVEGETALILSNLSTYLSEAL